MGSHIVSWELCHDEELHECVVHHICKNPFCCNPAHLVKMTIKEHLRLHNGKLKKWQVLEIRAKYAIGKYTQKQLAKEYNVSLSTINHIIKNRTWN